MSAPSKPRRDLRTRKGRRAEVLEKVRQDAGFSIFWVTENAARARAAMALQESGEILPGPDAGFPWIHMALRHPGRAGFFVRGSPAQEK